MATPPTPDPRVTRDDKGMIENPDLWPVWPYLPMKGPGPLGQRAEGFFFSANLNSKVVKFYEGNIFRPSQAVESTKSVDQVLADGWKVD